ncbi:hypothetical protein QUF75_18010 [Desulfococcaceae bacterium HSG7]|nr:hypothetical protein [Desulfococcaceae bacterium HSG7]
MDKTEDILKGMDNSEGQELLCRREFFIGLKKWSKIVISGTVISVAGASALSMSGCSKNNRNAAWANGSGGSAARGGNKSWVNRRGGKRR